MDIDNHPLEDDLKALEHRLTAWRPSAGALDRDRMLYDAGRSAAQSEGHVRSWRLATAALLALSIGLGVLLAHQRSSLAREQALLTQERSRRQALEAERMAGTRPSEPSLPVGIERPPIGPPAPSSYLVLTSRLAAGLADDPEPEVEDELGPRRPASEPLDKLPNPTPLRARDIRRVLEL